MTHFIRRGNEFDITSGATADVFDALPVGTYNVGAQPNRGFFLTKVDDMRAPSKIYGNAEADADRIIATFHDRADNTGVLLSGEKGGGKTMLARLIATKLHTRGISTLLISEPYRGTGFNEFMQSIHQPCMALFDEIEKVYGPSGATYYSGSEQAGQPQDDLLTLLDGTVTGKKLYVLTCNKVNKINRHMLNRPGRLFYHLRYKGLETAVIEQYTAEMLKNQKHVEGVKQVAFTVDNFSFDMLQALVEEMNRYGEDAPTAIARMNIRPESSEYVSYSSYAEREGKKYETSGGGSMTNPLTARGSLHVMINTGEKDSEGDDKYVGVVLEPNHLTSMKGNKMVFEKDGWRIVYERARYSEFSF